MSKKLRVPKRVLMTADTVGGVWTYALELARSLAAQEIEIGLATMGARLTSNQLAEISALPNIKLYQSAFKLEWMDEPRADVERAGHWLLEIEDSFQPDIVHLNSYSHGTFPWRSPKIVVGHSCVLSWWRAVNGCDAPKEWDEYRESVMAGLHGAELVVAPSRAMLADLNEHYGPFKTSAVIPNGRSLPGLKDCAKHEFVFAAGRLWDAAKNISSLAEIAPRLPWPIYVAGDENDPNGRRTNHEHVHYVGKLGPDEMLSYLERAAIYALPARYEPFGLSALEAALAGCALVLGDIPSLREIWGDAALFVNPEDPAALERALQDLIASPAETARLAAKARCAAQQYTPERMADLYLLAYASVITASRSESASEENPYASRTLLSNLVV
jgi:glycosyltransferase involved in cell wall biosynthesis